MHNADLDDSTLGAFFRNKWVRTALVVNIILILVLIVVSIVRASKTATIDFNVAPIDATISVNGNAKYKNGQYAIAPGTYEISISHDGLESKTLSVDVKSEHIVKVTAFLTGAGGDFSFYELKDNYDSYEKLKSIVDTDGDASAKQFISKFEQILSIFDKLPIKGYVYADPNINTSTAGFAIRSGQGNDECEKIACLSVKYYGKDYEDAVAEEVRAAGYNPGDYQFVYERYQYEFKG